jgi:N-acetylneuraminic acid mutarotase
MKSKTLLPAKAILLFTHVLIYACTHSIQAQELRPDGVYVPRMTTAQRDAIASPINGQLIYNTDDVCFNVYQDSGWRSMCAFDVTPIEKWTQKTNVGGAARNSAVGFSINNKGYVGTGYDASGKALNDFWEYNPATNVWTQKADVGGTVRTFAVGFSIGSKGYVGLGSDQTGNKKDFWEYDPLANAWTEKANFSGTARVQAVGFSIGNKGYVGTGYDSNEPKNDFWEYNPDSDTWIQKADVGGTVRSFAVGFSIGSKGYVGLGSDPAAFKKDFWEYDPLANAWTEKANFSGTARAEAVGFSIDNKGYVGTGYDSNAPKNDFWEYNPTTNTWTLKNNFGGSERYRSVGFSIGTKGYIGCGSTVNGFQNDLWEYDPLTIPVTTQGNSFNGANQLLKLNQSAGLELNGSSRVNGQSGGKTWRVETKAVDGNAHLEMRQIVGGGTPYLDFSNDSTSDFDARMILMSNTELQMSGGTMGFRLNVLGNVQSNGINLTSDRRFKTNFQPLQSSLSKVLQTNGLYYHWRVDEFKERNFNKDRQMGFVAQEIEKIFPELVQTDAQGYKSVDYARLTPVLVEAIKELSAKLVSDTQSLRSEIEELKKRVAAGSFQKQ